MGIPVYCNRIEPDNDLCSTGHFRFRDYCEHICTRVQWGTWKFRTGIHTNVHDSSKMVVPVFPLQAKDFPEGIVVRAFQQ